MVKRQKSVFDRLFLGADLPCEPIPGVPLVELLGDQRVLIENHNGVSAYGRNEICVKVKYGTISIQGDKLEFVRMTGKQLVITGCIYSVSLRRGASK